MGSPVRTARGRGSSQKGPFDREFAITRSGSPELASQGWNSLIKTKLSSLGVDVNFYNVCDDQEGKIMFERLITAIIMVVAVAIVASGLPLSSISGAGSGALGLDRKSTRLNSSHLGISYAVFCLK